MSTNSPRLLPPTRHGIITFVEFYGQSLVVLLPGYNAKIIAVVEPIHANSWCFLISLSRSDPAQAMRRCGLWVACLKLLERYSDAVHTCRIAAVCAQ